MLEARKLIRKVIFMIFINTLHLKPNMVLGRTLYDSNDSVLLTAYSVLNSRKIQRVKQLGVSGLFILEQFEDKDDVIRNVFEEIRTMTIETLDMDTILEIATKITYCVTESRNVNLTMLNLKEFDDYTYYHSVNVAIYSCIIAKKLGYHTEQLISLSLAGLLHDFGKLNIDKKILNATRKLSEKEFELIKMHPVCGYNLFKDRKEISEEVKLGILQHHEEEDGSGYPYHLKGNQISEFGKIIHVADVYDALVSKRPYKEPYPVQEAIEFLLGSCDTKFDREIVETFIQCVPVYPLETRVLLSNGCKATVIDNKNTIRPVVRLDSGEQIDLGDASSYNITITTNDITCNDLEGDAVCEDKILLISDCIQNVQALKMLLGREIVHLETRLLPDFSQHLTNAKTIVVYSLDSFERCKDSLVGHDVMVVDKHHNGILEQEGVLILDSFDSLQKYIKSNFTVLDSIPINKYA